MAAGATVFLQIVRLVAREVEIEILVAPFLAVWF